MKKYISPILITLSTLIFLTTLSYSWGYINPTPYISERVKIEQDIDNSNKTIQLYLMDNDKLSDSLSKNYIEKKKLEDKHNYYTSLLVKRNKELYRYSETVNQSIRDLYKNNGAMLPSSILVFVTIINSIKEKGINNVSISDVNNGIHTLNSISSNIKNVTSTYKNSINEINNTRKDIKRSEDQLLNMQNSIVLKQNEIQDKLLKIHQTLDEEQNNKDALINKIANIDHINYQEEISREISREKTKLAGTNTINNNSTHATYKKNNILHPYNSSLTNQVINFAEAQLGKPYVFGASGLDSFDCASLTMYAWRTVGYYIPRGAREQYFATTAISYDDLNVGDLVYWSTDSTPNHIYHVAIYIGSNKIIVAPHTGSYVKIEPLLGYTLTPSFFSRVY